MNAQRETDLRRLTSYETEHVQEIAAWKSEPPNPLIGLSIRSGSARPYRSSSRRS